MLLPLIFLLPVALPSIPLQVRASMVPMAALFLGVFGSAIGLIKLREGHMLPRLAVLPLAPHRLMAGYLAANILLDLLQLALPFAGAALLLGMSVSAVAMAAGVLVSAILASNALGALLAILAGSSGEVHLLAALAVLLVGGASGLFIAGGPPSGMASVIPYAALSSIMASLAINDLYTLSFLFSLSLLMVALYTSGRFFGCKAAGG